MYRYNVDYVACGTINLALHSWTPADLVKSVIFYVHGKQSHGGWLVETGAALANQNVVVFVLDRRGSGLSGGGAGNVGDLETLLSDYCNVLAIIKDQYPDIPFMLMGQSFGGTILAGLLCWDKFAVEYDSVIICASGLGLQRTDSQSALNMKNRVNTFDLKIPDEAYTNDPDFLKFISEDRFCVRSITHNTRKAFLELDELYIDKKGILANVPAVFIHPSHDPLIDYKFPLEIFSRLTSGNGVEIIIPYDKHYLEFSPLKKYLWSFLAGFSTMRNEINYA